MPDKLLRRDTAFIEQPSAFRCPTSRAPLANDKQRRLPVCEPHRIQRNCSSITLPAQIMD
ncbi:hypothetical protein N7478_007576 [Penicillium angulare]|uniref:uncharacterized protein n=1 Tax=Penicillium angulare TaxID=116970 RepID=UPI0025408993|nr:uncharacterized protein N7478_007576 [Penicillium angulare]KAJ5272451.1 hypothetical protein N7478_007576 [Penicillium angulare]